MMNMKIIYVRDSSGKKKPSKSKRLEAIRLEHQKFLASVGYKGTSRLVQAKPVALVAPSAPSIPSSSLRDMVAPCPKKDIFERTRNESDEVKAAIRAKAARTAPLWNKGGTMYITDDSDLTTLGKKV
jgi:hypothetical protein